MLNSLSYLLSNQLDEPTNVCGDVLWTNKHTNKTLVFTRFYTKIRHGGLKSKLIKKMSESQTKSGNQKKFEKMKI